MPMNTQIEALFTAALGLQSPWEVVSVELNTGKRRMTLKWRTRASGQAVRCVGRRIN